ncbi:MAG TPA: hypothetical protein VLB83_01945 [Candidatus Paceibacterota bacterium]|nr:hypothetical protein [Candidatus Paceibacterota bacterium]
MDLFNQTFFRFSIGFIGMILLSVAIILAVRVLAPDDGSPKENCILCFRTE